jgi:hypothetical protein
MSLIDSLLGPRVEHVIKDGEGGEFIISVRPRRSGSPVVRTTMVSFRRPGQRPGRGFGCQVWGLRLAVKVGERGDPIADSSIKLTLTAARNALDWVDGLTRKAGN